MVECEVVEEKKWLMLKMNIYEVEVVGSEISRRFLAPSNDPEASMRVPRHPEHQIHNTNVIVRKQKTSSLPYEHRSLCDIMYRLDLIH